MESDHLQQFLAEIEERICTCGAGHGSGEGHTDWCEWVEEYSCPPAPEAQQEPVAHPDNAPASQVLAYLLVCANSWEPEARIIGNARAGDIVRALSDVLPILMQPEAQQEAVAYRIHAPEDDYYGTGADRLQFHPLAQYDLDNGYRQTPLYAHPPAQAVTEAMVEAAAASLRPDLFAPLDADDLRSDDFAWTRREDAKADALHKARAALKAAMEAGR